MKFLFILLLSIATICAAADVTLPQSMPAAQPTQEPKKEPVPTIITSDQLEVLNNKERNQNEFHFDGNVKIVGDQLEATSDHLIVFADKENHSQASNQVGSVQEMIATGHVHIIQPERRAKAGKAIIYPPTGKLVLLENPIVFSKDEKGNESRVTGDRMELYREHNRAIVIGNPKERPKITLMGSAPTTPAKASQQSEAKQAEMREGLHKNEPKPVQKEPEPTQVKKLEPTPIAPKGIHHASH